MKRSIILIIAIITYCYCLQAQNPPVNEKGAPQSNNDLPSAGTQGSNSGVNPMGNPGTIINSSDNSSVINSSLPPNPNIEPGTLLNSSIQGTAVTGTPVNNGAAVKNNNAATVTNSGTVTNVVNEPVAVRPVTDTNPPFVKNKPRPLPPMAGGVRENPGTVTEMGNEMPAYAHPVLRNYIPEQIVNTLKAKYGNNLYDIRTIKVAPDDKTAYMVRLLEDGKLREELYYDNQ